MGGVILGCFNMRKTSETTKKAKGTLRKYREREAISVSQLQSVYPPELLSDEAKEIWKEVATTLTENQLLTGLDRRHLMMYCEEVATYWRMVESLSSEEDLIELYNDKGQPVNSFINPKYKLRDQCLKHAQVLGAHFGLTPLSRNKITITAPKEASPDQQNMDKLSQIRGKVVAMKQTG